MLAAVVNRADAPFELVDVAIGEPRDDEVVVRVTAVGVCHSDVAAQQQQLPFPLPGILGHEGAGIVEQVGAAVTRVAIGDHVVLSFAHCGECHNCRSHQPGYCGQFGARNMSGSRPDGSRPAQLNGQAVSSFFFGQSSFAERALVHQRNAIRIDRDMPLELAGPLGCGIQTGAGAVMRSLDLAAGNTLLITGAGTVGLAAVMAARIRDCATVIVSEPHAGRRALALELGATHAIDPAARDLAEAVRAIVPAGVDYALDTTGISGVIGSAIAALASLGSIGLVAVPSDPAAALSTHMLGLIGRGLTIRGICEGDSDPDVFIPELIALYKAGRFPLDRLVSTYPLHEINRAVADQLAGLCVKPVLLPETAR